MDSNSSLLIELYRSRDVNFRIVFASAISTSKLDDDDDDDDDADDAVDDDAVDVESFCAFLYLQLSSHKYMLSLVISNISSRAASSLFSTRT